MKKILKNNQVIITALAIMIAIAGYLNYVQKIGDENDYQSVISGDINDLDQNLFDISEEDIFAENQATGNLQAGEGTEVLQGSEENVQNKDGLIDIESMDSEPQDVSGNVPGEAVLTGGTTVSSIVAVKLKREQSKSLQKSSLMEIINNAGISEVQKQDAISKLLEVNDISQKEAEAELLLEAKGFTDVVVSITDGSVDVVVNASSLSDADRAQIEDIVKRKTEISADKIIIMPFVENN
ncbi:MAG: SpoIIIAH-like family protein [Lachnospiraceae bacterium]|nr:SpoIIIAH-like family protein [Lachnospiraceae bacterium]